MVEVPTFKALNFVSEVPTRDPNLNGKIKLEVHEFMMKVFLVLLPILDFLVIFNKQ